MESSDPEELRRIYERRFRRTADYRRRVWSLLTASFFSRWVKPQDSVLDLGCGYGEFINQTAAREKFAIDLNPEAPTHLAKDVRFFEQDCSKPWPVPPRSLDIVFTSNFFEHLPDKQALRRTLQEAAKSLKPGGRLIAMGPNIKYLTGAYWDFFDHHTILTETSLSEVLEIEGFEIEWRKARFLPYTLVNAPEYPLWMLRCYLALPIFWPLFGRQFLVVARRSGARQA